MEIIKEQNVESFNVSRLLFYEIHQLCIKSNSNTEKCLVMQSISPMMPRIKCKKHTVVSLLRYYFAECGDYNCWRCVPETNENVISANWDEKHSFLVYACVRNILTTVCTRQIHHLRSSNIIRSRGYRGYSVPSNMTLPRNIWWLCRMYTSLISMILGKTLSNQDLREPFRGQIFHFCPLILLFKHEIDI